MTRLSLTRVARSIGQAAVVAVMVWGRPSAADEVQPGAVSCAPGDASFDRGFRAALQLSQLATVDTARTHAHSTDTRAPTIRATLLRRSPRSNLLFRCLLIAVQALHPAPSISAGRGARRARRRRSSLPGDEVPVDRVHEHRVIRGGRVL